MLTIIEQFNHWRIPTQRRLTIVGKEDHILPKPKTGLIEVAAWLPNDLALAIYHQICALKGRTVFIQLKNEYSDSSETTAIQFAIEHVYIRIVDVMGIPLPQAFIKGRSVKRSVQFGKYQLKCQQPVDINIADLFRLSTINPDTTFRKKRKRTNQAFLES